MFYFLKKSTALSFSNILAILGKTVDGIRILQEVRSKLAEVSWLKNSWKIQWPAAFTSRIFLTLLNCRGHCMVFSHFSSRMWPDSQTIPEFLLTTYVQKSGHKTTDFNYCAFNVGNIFFFFFWKFYSNHQLTFLCTIQLEYIW